MNHEVNAEKTVIKFRDLPRWMRKRLAPITQQEIADKTKHFGHRYSRDAVAAFIIERLGPTAVSVEVITDTIEGGWGITIDFTGTIYEKREESPDHAPSLPPQPAETQ